MKNFIVWLIIALTFIGSIIYFVFSSDSSLNVTYIKFNINPDFIGVNSNDEVKIYNPLNDDAKVLNLNMFNGYSLERSMKIILDNLEKKGYLDIDEINITVITKSEEKIKKYYDKIADVINESNSSIKLINNKASHDELLAYSNEVSYDLKPRFNSEDFKNISLNLKEDISNYVNNLINELNLDDLELVDKIDVITQKELEGYFNNYSLTSYQINNYDLIVNDNSNYKVKLSYNDEGYSFDIELNLVLEYFGEFEKEEIVYQTIEEYHFAFRNNEIYGLKSNFYKFN